MDVTHKNFSYYFRFFYKWAKWLCKLVSFAPEPVYTVNDMQSANVELKVLRIKARKAIVIALGEAAIGMTAEKAILLSDELVRAAVDVQPEILQAMSDERDTPSTRTG